MMKDTDRIRVLLLQIDCGLIRCDQTFRNYLNASLDFQNFRSRFANRTVRRWLWHFKLVLVLVLFWVLTKQILGSIDDSILCWTASIAIGSGLATTLSDNRKERVCQDHFECCLQLSVDQVPRRFPYEWQTGTSARCLNQFADGIEWDLEWGLRRREARTALLLGVGLLISFWG